MFAATAAARLMHRILRQNLWCVLPKIDARFRRFVSRAIAEFSPPLANDYGFDEIFARQVAAFGVPGDVLICLTTSGKSKNVVRALQEAKARQMKTIALLGRDGGSTIGIADLDLLVKSDSTARVQEAHQLLLHVLCEIIESRLDKSIRCSRFAVRSVSLNSPSNIAHPPSPRLPRGKQGDGYRLFEFFSNRSRSRSNCRRSLAVRLPIPNLEILSRIGSIDV